MFRVFIGSSSPGLPLACAVAKLVREFATPILWNDQVFGATGANLQALRDQMNLVDAAVLVFSEDDLLTQGSTAGPPLPIPRGNVVFETGLFMGALGRERTVFLMPQPSALCLPSDLAGEAWICYPREWANNLAATLEEIRRWLAGLCEHVMPIIRWPNPLAHGRVLLSSSRGEAQHSVLLLGNTLSNLTHASDADRRAWLSGDARRRMGMLILNPHGPHAQGRDREHLHQGRWQEGLATYKQSQTDPPHQHCLALIYDGPYRYSARCIDAIGKVRTSASEIHVTHSTHTHGIEGGYGLSLPYRRGEKAFDSFADDVLSLWREGWSNPPGHGITLAVCRPVPVTTSEQAEENRWVTRSREVLTQAAEQLHKPHQARGASFCINPASQWHFTLSSLRRTGYRWGGPFSLTAPGGSDEHLPARFAEYAQRSCETLQAALKAHSVTEFVPRLTHLKRTAAGHLIAFSPETKGPLVDAMADFVASRPRVAQSLGLDAAYLPKHGIFWPHTSVGMAFQDDASLPEPLTGSEDVIELEEPITWRATHFHAVHYAYRTFRRIVGSFAVPLLAPSWWPWTPSLDREALVRGLRIG